MNLETKPGNPFQLIDTIWSKISARKAYTMPIKKMKRKIQCGLASDMSGTTLSVQAFVLSTQGRPNGATFESTNLGGTLGFNQKLSLGTKDSVSFSGPAFAFTLVASSFLAYDFNGIPGIQMNDLPGFFNQTVFMGS